MLCDQIDTAFHLISVSNHSVFVNSLESASICWFSRSSLNTFSNKFIVICCDVQVHPNKVAHLVDQSSYAEQDISMEYQKSLTSFEITNTQDHFE